jgi:hypothetical protein
MSKAAKPQPEKKKGGCWHCITELICPDPKEYVEANEDRRTIFSVVTVDSDLVSHKNLLPGELIKIPVKNPDPNLVKAEKDKLATQEENRKKDIQKLEEEQRRKLGMEFDKIGGAVDPDAERKIKEMEEQMQKKRELEEKQRIEREAREREEKERMKMERAKGFIRSMDNFSARKAVNTWKRVVNYLKHKDTREEEWLELDKQHSLRQERDRARMVKELLDREILVKSKINLIGLLVAINDLRKNPQRWADIVEYKYLSKVSKEGIHSITKEKYYEGRNGIKQAIKFLRKQKSQPALYLSDGLTVKAYQMSVQQADQDINTKKGAVNAIDQSGINVGINMENESPMKSAFDQFDESQLRNSELAQREKNRIEMEQEEIRELETILVNLVIDDGVKNRHHRMQLFNPQCSQIGIGLYKIPELSADGRERFKITLEYASSRYTTVEGSISGKLRTAAGLDLFHSKYVQEPLKPDNSDFYVAFSVPIEHQKLLPKDQPKVTDL